MAVKAGNSKKKSETADGCHFENRKIVTFRDNAEWVTQVHWPSILDF